MMIGYGIFVTIILIFMGLTVFGMISSKNVEKTTRQVDVRVLACLKQYLNVANTERELAYYEVTVDFIGLQGETITKSFKSDKHYEEGDIIRCRYSDKSDKFYPPNAQGNAKSNSASGIIIIGVCLVMLAIVTFGVWVSEGNDGQTPDWALYGFGYFVGGVFTLVGLMSFVRRRKLRDRRPDMRVIEGTQVDYKKERSHGSGHSMVYYPIYEYEAQGETKRLYSKMGGSAGKYSQIGRKVHILMDPSTGDVYCEEDEKSSGGMMAVFFVVGIAIIGILAAVNLGYLSSN